MSGMSRGAAGLIFLLMAFPDLSSGQNLFISEFMAVRSVEVLDDDGDDNDFVEIFNAGTSTESLGGYFLSDDCADPFKWTFPVGVEIAAGDFLVVWASEKDRTNPDFPLHTNFRLDGDGECLVLSDALGDQIHSYGPYPNQQLGYTYGLAMNGALFSLVSPGTPCTVTVPPVTDPPDTSLDWTLPEFDDVSWTQGKVGVGYDSDPDYHPMISLDLGTSMRNVNRTCYIRVPFQVDDPSAITSFEFGMQYDDGFIAYVNGTRVASRKAPGSPNSTSGSLGFQLDSRAFDFEDVPFDEGAPTLRVGENILAIHGLNETLNSSDFLAVPRLVGSGSGGGLQIGTSEYFEEPTPGSVNFPGLPGVSERPLYSEPSGAYPPGLSITLSMEAPVEGTEIRYTLDESVPTQGATLYTGPIDVEGEVVITARAFQPGLQPSKPIFRHYLILGADVLNFSSGIPLVVCSTLGRGIARACSSGDYTQGRFLLFTPGADGRAYLNGEVSFEHYVGFRRRGNPAIGCLREKFYFNVEFRDREDKDDDEQVFEGFAVHSDYAMFPPWEIDRSFMRNPLAYWMSREVGRWAPQTEFVECFLHRSGGQELTMDSYWGVYVFMERVERGVGRVDVNRLDVKDNEHPDVSGGYIVQRDRTKTGDVSFTAGGYNHIVFASPQDPTPEQANYIRGTINTAVASFSPNIGSQADSNLIDVGSFLDHHILMWYPKNIDAFRFSAYMHKPRNGLLTAGPVWDYDRSMGCASDPRPENPLGYNNTVAWDSGAQYFVHPGSGGDSGTMGSWWGHFFDNEPPLGSSRWARAYRTRWRELRAGPLKTATVSGQIDEWAALLIEPARRDLSRWRVQPRFGGYPGEIEHLKDWLEIRARWIDDEFGIADAPTFSPRSGEIETGSLVEIFTDVGVIYYTLNGPDPRGGNGLPNPVAKRYDGPIQIDGNTQIRARSTSDGSWSELGEAGYVTGATTLVVTEIMYNPRVLPGDRFGKSVYEFLELYNPGPSTVNLLGVNLADPEFEFTFQSAVTEIGVGEYIVLVRDRDAFLDRYGDDGILIAGEYDGILSNSFQNILLTGPSGEALMDFRYQDSWEPSTDGQGRSLVIRSPTAEPSTWALGSSWRPSAEEEGSPGRADTVAPLRLQGDLNGNGHLEIADVMSLLFNLFGPVTLQPCESEASNRELQDTDGDGQLTIVDAVRVLNYLYLAGEPPAKGRDCVQIPGCPGACD